MDYVKIFDTTLRDGEQSPGCSMNTEEKVRLAKQLEKLGVDTIEAGFPIASPDDFKAVQAIAKVLKKPEVCALARAKEEDIKTAYQAIKDAKKPRIHTFLATSDIHLQYKLKMTKEQALKQAVEMVKLAKSLCSRVDFSPEDAARSDKKYLFAILKAVIEAGADTINIPDTVGYAMPQEFGDLIAEIIKNVPLITKKGIIVSTHCHNDLGLAVANSLAGVVTGARQVEGTINGIGERAGNASLEEVVMALQTRKAFYKIKTGINTKEIYRTSKLLTKITGVVVQPNKAIVGANAFAHEAGIHQDGILKQRETYEIMRPEDIGIEKSKLVLGKHSGRHAFFQRLTELGYKLSKEELEKAFLQFKILADQKKEVFDEDLELIASEGSSEMEKTYTLEKLNVVCGTLGMPTASIELRHKSGVLYQNSEIGAGPVDAAYQAINKIAKVKTKLLEFAMNAVTEGIDAQAVVHVRVQINKKVYSGAGSSNDIVVASVKAYLKAINKYLGRG